MKKITKEERDAMQLKPPGHMTPLRGMIINMKVGDLVHLEKSDWKWKSKAPSAMLRRYEDYHPERFTCMEVVGGNGWVIERVQ